MSNQNNQNDSQNSKPPRRNNNNNNNHNQYVNNNNTMRSYNQRGSNNNYKNNIKQPQLDTDSANERYFNRNSINQQQRSYQKSRLNQQTDQLELDNNSNEQSSNRTKQSRLISISSSTGTTINCICCLHELETYAYYLCQHYVCLKCAVKMRILCQKIDCPVCRRESKQILCTKKPVEDDKKLDELIKNCPNYSRPYKLNPTPSCAQTKPPEPEFLPNAGINFDSDEIKEEYNEILSSKCHECSDVFREFDQLDQHMRKTHRKFFCELCLENLKLFPYERKYYSREDLATHKRTGDKSGEFKGHPLCHYCDNRFYDKDDLYRHYRKEHYFCHFCDSDGYEEYYKDYSELRTHFLESHYLCELDNCSLNAAETHEYVVFRNELDLQAHKKQVHARTKNDMKTYGKINIEFNVNRDRPINSNRNKQQNQQRNNNRNDRNRNRNNAASANVQSTSEDEDDTLTVQPKTEIKPSEIINDLNEFPSVLKSSEEDQKKINEASKKNEENKPTTSSEISEALQSVGDTNQTQSQWRNLISQGNAPKINQETEFPSLSSTIDPRQTSTSLAEFGFKTAAAIPSMSKRQAKKEAKKQQTQSVSTVASMNQPTQKLITQNLASTITVQPSPLPPPPGFSQITKTFATPSTPPPGFESTKSNKSSTASQSSPYIRPNYYDTRNEQLSIKLKNLFGIFDETEYETFRNLSIQFRQNRLDAMSYLAKSRALLDGPLLSDNYINKENLETINSHLKFIDLVQEMIVLLPDVKKQNELYKAFTEYADIIKDKLSNSNESVTQKPQSKKIWNKNVSSNNNNKSNETKQTLNIKLNKCEYCNQYFLSEEIDNHKEKAHSVKFLEQKSVINTKLDEEYPSLSSAATTNLPMSSQSMGSFLGKVETTNKPAKTANRLPNASKSILKEDFPPLSTGMINNDETRFSALPTPSLFSNPSSHLSLVNKKKHRLQK